MISLDTPVRDDDSPDLGAVWDAVRAVTKALVAPATMVINSQVPVGTCEEILAYVRSHGRRLGCEIAYNPEFLQLGRAIELFLRPDRIVIGARKPHVARRVARLYAALGRPTVLTDLRTAEMIKHASNSFLATSVSFANEIATICESVGANFWDVARALRMDRRIGPHAYLNAGLGFGGGTLGRDLRALQALAAGTTRRTPLIDAVVAVNRRQQNWALDRLNSLLGDLNGRKIGILGLAYKPGTDTLRRSHALTMMRRLLAQGASVAAYDPLVDARSLGRLSRLDFSADVYQAARDCDAVVVVTGGPDVGRWNFSRLGSVMKRRIFLDCQHVVQPGVLTRHGFSYFSPGLGDVRPGSKRR
jgi:UDPglucose 6-dehydrogenase